MSDGFATKVIFNMLEFLPPFIAISGAIAAWLPFLSKKPLLTLVVMYKHHMVGQSSLEFKINNKGNDEAKEIEIFVQLFTDNKRSNLISKPLAVSGNLLPGEVFYLTIPFSQWHNTSNNTNSYVIVDLKYKSIVLNLKFYKWKREYVRNTTWYFTLDKNKPISSLNYKLCRIEKI